jgi:predicted nucleotidyltransferase component of viral defense system
MSFLGSKRSVKQNEKNNTIVYRFETEIAPVINFRLKLEINCREHFSELGFKKLVHSMDSSWFSGSTEIISYELEELLGTKLRALYQRKKGRDLFDIYYALIQLNPDCNKIIACYKRYMRFSSSRAKTSKEFLINMDKKMKSDEFNSDTVSILRPDVAYDFNKAYELVKKNIIDKI